MTTTCLIFENDTGGGGGFVIGGFVIGGFVIEGWEPPPHAIRIANAQILQKTATARAPLVSRPMIENPPGRSPLLKMPAYSPTDACVFYRAACCYGAGVDRKSTRL